jgi:hypothetical protein
MIVSRLATRLIADLLVLEFGLRRVRWRGPAGGGLGPDTVGRAIDPIEPMVSALFALTRREDRRCFDDAVGLYALASLEVRFGGEEEDRCFSRALTRLRDDVALARSLLTPAEIILADGAFAEVDQGLVAIAALMSPARSRASA